MSKQISFRHVRQPMAAFVSPDSRQTAVFTRGLHLSLATAQRLRGPRGRTAGHSSVTSQPAARPPAPPLTHRTIGILSESAATRRVNHTIGSLGECLTHRRPSLPMQVCSYIIVGLIAGPAVPGECSSNASVMKPFVSRLPLQ